MKKLYTKHTHIEGYRYNRNSELNTRNTVIYKPSFGLSGLRATVQKINKGRKGRVLI